MGVESVRLWGRQADIDNGLTGGVTSDATLEIQRLEQENRELKRANGDLKRPASFFGAEPNRQHKMHSSSCAGCLRRHTVIWLTLGTASRQRGL